AVFFFTPQISKCPVCRAYFRDCVCCGPFSKCQRGSPCADVAEAATCALDERPVQAAGVQDEAGGFGSTQGTGGKSTKRHKFLVEGYCAFLWPTFKPRPDPRMSGPGECTCGRNRTGKTRL